MDVNEQRVAMVRSLFERTEAGEIRWSCTDNAVSAKVADYTISILPPDEYGGPSYTVTVRDAGGKARDEFSDDSDTWDLLRDLYDMAASGTRGPRAALNDILDKLGGKA